MYRQTFSRRSRWWGGIAEYRREFLEEAKDRWRWGIESAWSNRFNLVRTTAGASACDSYRLLIGVAWVDLSEPERRNFDASRDTRADWVVAVRPFWDREASTVLGLNSSGAAAAHEFGHWIGANDEYDGTCDGCPDRPIVDRSIMNDADAYPDGVMRHHLVVILLWMVSRLCAGFELVPVEPGLTAGIDLGLDIAWNTDIPTAAKKLYEGC